MNINATLLAQAVVMIVFVAICWRYIYPPILAVMQEREKKIADGLEAAKKAEAANILKSITATDVLVLLDETGKMLSSPGLSKLIQQKANQSAQRIVFLIGGAYGVEDEIKKRANFSWSLSELVFPHMLVRLLLAEQIYRACSILANEKYHHE